MKILRLGSKGNDVKTLQKMLGVDVDGIFGPMTERAVKEFQASHGLVSDGIVGFMTWSALGFKSCVDPSIIYAPLSCCITKSPNRKIRYIAIHYTAGASSAPGRAINMKNGWEKTKRASADFGVDDRDMVQFNPDPLNYKCWSVGDKKNPYSGGGSLYGIATNSNTISIEICSNLTAGYNSSKANHAGWYYTDAALDNAVRLVKILMKKYSIPIERVVRHYDISGKLCPGIVGWNNGDLYGAEGNKMNMLNNSSKWEEFKKRLLED